MNLQVNMILDFERRSGSSISRKFVIRVVSVSVPIVLLCILIPLVIAARSAKQNRLAAEEEEKKLDPVYKVVMDLKEKSATYQFLLDDLEGWRQSRLDWYEMLTGLQMIAPPNVQFTRLTVNEKIELVDTVPARTILMMMKGKVVGKDAKEDVRLLDRNMKEMSPFSSLLSGVEVRLLGGSDNPEEPDVRVFDATCNFMPRKMGEKKPARKEKKEKQ